MYMYLYVKGPKRDPKGLHLFHTFSYYFNLFQSYSTYFIECHTFSVMFILFHTISIYIILFQSISYYFILFPTPHYRGLPWHRVLHLPEILVVLPRQELPRQSSARTATLQLQHNGETIKKSGDWMWLRPTLFEPLNDENWTYASLNL